MAHQYQQIGVKLHHDKYWGIELRGAAPGQYLSKARANSRGHLTYYYFENAEILWLRFWPDVFYLDLKQAIESSNILKMGLPFQYFERPKPSTQKPRSQIKKPGQPKVQFYDFDMQDLELQLKAGGHQMIPPP